MYVGFGGRSGAIFVELYVWAWVVEHGFVLRTCDELNLLITEMNRPGGNKMIDLAALANSVILAQI